mmetsp:Transcript_39257/g.82363  ORF Transcript_39257/g.82363 Transcript_39257/m.82363 type:complete len:315 (+) Transcript_39257:164-1108(+)
MSTLDSPERKRQRSSNLVQSIEALPQPGDEQTEWLEEQQLLLQYGSSLSLMARVGAFLNDSSNFNEIDPTDDWEAWTSRRPDFQLFYAALTDPTTDRCVCVLRAVLDGIHQRRVEQDQPPRFMIDYITTDPAQRARGLATFLVEFVLEASRMFGANTYVLATEDSCVYWMSKGFVLEENRSLNARLNIFPDTHLLRREGDAHDAGAAEDLDLGSEAQEGEGGDGAKSGDNDDSDAEVSTAADRGGGAAEALVADDADAEMQRALELSLASKNAEIQRSKPASSEANIEGQESSHGPYEPDEDEELQEALRASLQ